MEGPNRLLRSELAKFLPSQRAIRAFEQLFDVVPSQITQNTTSSEDASIAAASADSRAQQAVSAIDRLAEAVELLALAPARSPETQNVDIAPPVAIQSVQEQILPPIFEQNKRKRYGVFQSDTTQVAAVINTAYGMTFDVADLSFGVRIGTPASRIYVDTEGIYNIQFSAQLVKTTGGIGLVYIWLRINGVDLPASATKIRIQGNNAEAVAAWNFVVPLGLNDYFQLMWSVDDIHCQIQASAAVPPAPSIPSLLLTVTDNIS